MAYFNPENEKYISIGNFVNVLYIETLWSNLMVLSR